MTGLWHRASFFRASFFFRCSWRRNRPCISLHAAMATGNFIAYYRVSTRRQGHSGLGLRAQQAAVADYLNGGPWRLVAEVKEIESGKKSDRPKLAEALRLCGVHNATLIIAKLDRLARNVAFVSTLMEAGVEFVAVDFPQANRLTIHVLAAVAEHETKAISERTKAALARSTKKLGGWRGHPMQPGVAAKGRAPLQARADARVRDLAPIIEERPAEGVTSLRGLAKGLEERKIATPSGSTTWTAASVSRLLARLAHRRSALARLPAHAPLEPVDRALVICRRQRVDNCRCTTSYISRFEENQAHLRISEA
jgi:DNA invertase Pin-like site-specific DNA recombinase